MNIQTLNLSLAFVLTIVLGMIVVPILKRHKIGQIVRDDGPQSHLKKSGTPIMGGIVMIIVSSILLAINAFKYPVLILAMISILGFGIIGFIDDYKKLILKNTEGLSPKKKMLGLFIVTAIFIFAYLKIFNLGTDIIIPLFHQPFALSMPVFIIFTAFILLGTSNAVNLTDGLDGLASGVVAIIMTFFTLIALKNGEQDMVILGSVVTGTCIGFLVFNFHPAKVFMGDTGSLALGGAVAAIAIIMKMPLYLAIVAFVCIIDTLSVILQVLYFKATKGKRLFKMAPFHHHLELSGMKETKVVFLFWIVTVLFCILAYLI
ncbi:MAG: phospho-N-acetylmuramoyl-pentapeptide-transferase [Clostridia bacterium]|nr:phospho-N-acetylmuramoyl-pentapeptide-transferase [Clostridia bacterium]